MMDRIRDYTFAVECALRNASGGNASANVTLTPIDESLPLSGLGDYGARATRWLMFVHVQKYVVVEPGSLVYHKPAPPIICSTIIYADESAPSPQKVVEMLFPQEKTGPS